MMGYYGYGGFSWIGMILSMAITIGVIVAFTFLVVWAVRRMSGSIAQSSNQPGIGQSARDVAQVRYAKGEISRDEYQLILSDLEK